MRNQTKAICRSLLWASLLWLFASGPAASVMADERLFSIALYFVGGKSLHEMAEELALKISADLRSSGRFGAMDLYSTKFLDLDAEPRLPDWRGGSGVDYSLEGSLRLLPDGRIVINIVLADVANGKLISDVQYLVLPEDINRMSHFIAKLAIERVTGQANPSGVDDKR